MKNIRFFEALTFVYEILYDLISLYFWCRNASDSDVESPNELERMSIYVTRMERESRLGTLNRGPYPLEIQPPTLVVANDELT